MWRDLIQETILNLATLWWVGGQVGGCVGGDTDRFFSASYAQSILEALAAAAEAWRGAQGARLKPDRAPRRPQNEWSEGYAPLRQPRA